MNKPRVDKLLNRTGSRYATAIIASKRSRQINSYYRALAEGAYDEYPPPMVETENGNHTTIALEEIAQGKLRHTYRG